MARRAQPMAADREARLFRAAAEEFLRYGFETASLNRIISTAEMPKSSFYHYFTDKRDLHDRMMHALVAAVDEFVRPPDLAELDEETFWPAMSTLLEGITRMAAERPVTVELARLFHALPEGVDSAADSLREAARAWSDAALRRGTELGVVRADLPSELLAEIVFSILVALDRWALRTESAQKTSPDLKLALHAVQRLIEGT
ncbi:MAG TPA: TetR/AcrR family transcriptional regulator [Candidatus Agrococcus pullicola]|uniref:TetR/AcrR family transcriptional regulator n=1 Tax=Candidatus Agrococcus pullicola TaxID=2838429 RepID=A0A9D1YVG3_9MICO|nr:TetR/AcrR family transcriptional regulator [Candidatus Agrococcus pullicola]